MPFSEVSLKLNSPFLSDRVPARHRTSSFLCRDLTAVFHLRLRFQSVAQGLVERIRLSANPFFCLIFTQNFFTLNKFIPSLFAFCDLFLFSFYSKYFFFSFHFLYPFWTFHFNFYFYCIDCWVWGWWARNHLLLVLVQSTWIWKMWF